MNNKEYLSKEEIEKYLNSEMSRRDMHNTELKIEEDSLNNSAFEGYKSNPGALDDIDILKRKFNSQHKTNENRNLNSIKVFYSAAAIIVIVFLSYFFIDLISPESDSGISDNLEPVQIEDNVELEDSKINNLNPQSLEVKTNQVPVVSSPVIEMDDAVEVVENDQEELKVMDINIPEEKDYGKGVKRSHSYSSAMAPAGVNPEIEVNVMVESAHVSFDIAKRSEIHDASVVYLFDLKIIDYTQIYEGEIEKFDNIDHGGVDPRFESKKRVNNTLANEDVIEDVTYLELLKESIYQYKSGQYELALSNFRIILREHPEDLNAWFYSAQSFFELGEYSKAIKNFDFIIDHPINEFNQESEWYKALTFIKLNYREEAANLLQKIIGDSLFYSQKAKSELENLIPE